MEREAGESPKSAWDLRLFAAYEASGNPDNLSSMARLAEEIFLGGNPEFYGRLKSIRLELGGWEELYAKLLEEMKRHFPSNAYMRILGKENETALPMEAIRSHPAAICDYGARLSTDYPEEIAEMFLADIAEHDERMKSRDEYATVCKMIRNFRDAGFEERAASPIAEYRIRFAKRPAFLDELRAIER